jgi:hypothetical protein
MAQNEMVELKI